MNKKIRNSVEEFLGRKIPKDTVYTLFDRHELPANRGAMCKGFNFKKFEPKIDEHVLANLVNDARRTSTVSLIVTGLTPALTYVLHMLEQLNIYPVLLHYDKEKGDYVEQLTNPFELSSYLKELAIKEAKEFEIKGGDYVPHPVLGKAVDLKERYKERIPITHVYFPVVGIHVEVTHKGQTLVYQESYTEVIENRKAEKFAQKKYPHLKYSKLMMGKDGLLLVKSRRPLNWEDASE